MAIPNNAFGAQMIVAQRCNQICLKKKTLDVAQLKMQQLLGDSLHSGIVWGVQKFQQHQFFLIKMQQEETHPQHCNEWWCINDC